LACSTVPMQLVTSLFSGSRSLLAAGVSVDGGVVDSVVDSVVGGAVAATRVDGIKTAAAAMTVIVNRMIRRSLVTGPSSQPQRAVDTSPRICDR
jgi:hypothetical protein